MRKHFRFKKAFSMILFSYIAILLIPVALAAGFSVTANRMSINRCMDDVANNLWQGKLLLEKQLEAMDGNAMYLTYDYVLKRMLQMEPLQPGDKKVWFVSEFHGRLNDIFSDSSVLYAWCLLMSNDYVFHMNGVSQGLEFYFQNSRNYLDMSFEEYLDISFQASGPTLLPLGDIKLGRDTIRAMTYSYPILHDMGQAGTADAAVQFLIREEDLERFFFPLLQKNGSRVLLLDGEGKELAALGSGEAAEIEFDIREMTREQGSLSARMGGERSLLVYQKSKENNLIIAAVIPENIVLEDARRLRRISLIMMSLCVLLELAMGIYFAWKYSAPIRNLVRNVYLMINGSSDAEQQSMEDKSEYEHLESGINQIMQTNRTMQTTLQERQERERKNFLGYLFAGAFSENEDVIREGALIGMELGDFIYCVVSYELEDTGRGAACLRERGWKHVLAVYGTGEYLSVLFGLRSEDQWEELVEVIREMTGWLERQLGCSLKAGAGRTYEDERDIQFSYMQSVYSASWKETQEIVFYSSISQDFNSLCYPAELEARLMNSSKHGELVQIHQIFAFIREENMGKRHLSRSMGRILASNLVATLLKVYNDVIPGEELDQMVNEILRYTDLSEALGLLEQQFVRIGEESARSRDQREESYQRRLISYIEANYNNPQLCVAMAAEEFTLSENYFSQFFKEVMKESFSVYLESLRIQKAKELIREGSYNLEQIAGMAGYQNSGTFRRAFKRVVGISPSAWKQEDTEAI